jgi:hypothetical protein
VNLRVAVIAVTHFLAPTRSASGEAETAYAARLDTIGASVATVAENARSLGWRGRPVDLAAALLVLVDEESRFDERIHAGTKHPVWTGDKGKSACLLQVQRTRLVQNWEALAGTGEDSTVLCLTAGARMFTAQFAACAHGPITESKMAEAFSAYGAGHCGPASALGKARAAKWMRVLRRIESTR